MPACLALASQPSYDNQLLQIVLSTPVREAE